MDGAVAGPKPPGAARRWLERHPGVLLGYRVVVGVVGGLVVVIGLILVPFPGPGWLTVFAGFALLGTEFAWAKRVARWVKRQLDRFWAWWQRRRELKRARRTALAE